MQEEYGGKRPMYFTCRGGGHHTRCHENVHEEGIFISTPGLESIMVTEPPDLENNGVLAALIMTSAHRRHGVRVGVRRLCWQRLHWWLSGVGIAGCESAASVTFRLRIFWSYRNRQWQHEQMPPVQEEAACL